MTGNGLPRSPRMWLALGAAGVAALASTTLRTPAVIPGNDGGVAFFAALTSAGIVVLILLPFVAWRGARRPRIALGVACVALALGVAAFYAAGEVQRGCTAGYGGARVVIGSDLTPLGLAYRQANPQLSNDDLLFDAAGAAETIWTAPSIGRCRTLLSSMYFLWIPLLVAALATAAQAAPAAILIPSRRKVPHEPEGAHAAIRYDVFISYRHSKSDADFARQLLGELEDQGYRVAIDERDFLVNRSFLQEMERCIRESRFTVAVISRAYLESGNCEEEAAICKVLDMGDRKRRLIPFVVEPVSMPTWLYGIVGIDGTRADPLVDHLERLIAALGPPSLGRCPSGDTAQLRP